MKKMKRAATAALTIGMLISSAPYAALADASQATAGTLTQEQAIEAAKKYIKLPDGYQFRDATLQEDKGGLPPFGRSSIWIIHFSKQNQFAFGEINVVIDAKTAKLLDLNVFQRDDAPIENAISREEAKAKAVEYLKRFDADKIDQVQEMGDAKYPVPYGSQTVTHSFRFVRMVNGIPYPMDGVSIMVNGNGELRSYHYNWTESVQFPQPNATITEQQAKEAFRNALNLQLQYIAKLKPYKDRPDEARLVYGPWGQYGLPMIDATKGVAIDREGNPLPAGQTGDWKPLADRPGAPKTTKELTKEAALELLKSYNLGLEGYTLQGSNYQNGPNNQPVWQFDFQQGDPKDFQIQTLKRISVMINVKTGELLHLFRMDFRKGPQEFPANPAISREQAQAKAIEFVKNALPTAIHQIAFDSSTQFFGAGYRFNFVTLVNGTPLRDPNIFVEIDPNTGEVREYYGGGGWLNTLAFPTKENLIGAETAKEKYLEKYPVRLQYVPIFEPNQNPYGKPYDPTKPKGVQLVYAPLINDAAQLIDAKTGEWVSPWGGQPGQPVQASDIKGHWAEKQMQYFLDRGIYTVKDGKLNPDAGVTRAETVRYLVMAVDGPVRALEKQLFDDVPKTDPNYQFIEEAAARKWIDPNVKNFRPNDVITREEFADLVTAILGYGKLSDSTDTFKIHFRDVSVESDGKYVGDIEIAAALGLMSGWEGNFMPKRPLTKAQAAVVMVKLLDQLKEKQNPPYFISK